MREFSAGAGDEWVDSGEHHTQDGPERAKRTLQRRLHVVVRHGYFTVLTGRESTPERPSMSGGRVEKAEQVAVWPGVRFGSLRREPPSSTSVFGLKS